MEPSVAIADARALWSRIAAFRKGEFETETEYRVRVWKTVGVNFVAVAVTDSNAVRYNADRGGFEIRLWAEPWGRRTLYDSPERIFALRTDWSDGPAYVGENAMGVRRRVLRDTRTSYGVVVSRPAFANQIVVGRALVRMGVDSARSLRSWIRLALVISPTRVGGGPFTVEETNVDEPTVSKPTEFTKVERGLRTDEAWVVLYDSRSRRIIWMRDVGALVE